MVHRLTSLSELVERYEPACAGLTGADLEACWMERACRSLCKAAREVSYSEANVRHCALHMMIDSATRLKIAQDSCEALSYRMESGIRSIIVAGSVARCEALPTSDVDFNVFATDAYVSALFTRRSARAKTSHELMMGLERELRKRMRMEILMEAMHQRGYPEWEDSVTLKPFSFEQLYDSEKWGLAIGHLLNLMFSAVPVLGEVQFEALLDELLQDPDAIHGALLGRIALLYARSSVILASAEIVPAGESADTERTVINALHAIAGVISALLSAGLSEDDPQIPYWWTMDAVAAGALEPATRETLERFLVKVTLARGELLDYDVVAMKEELERTLANLSSAMDSIIEWQAAHGASDEMLARWGIVSEYVLDPGLSQALAHDLGMVRD